MCIERRKECAPCGHRHTCIYSYVFETSVPEVRGSTIRNEEVPHPFIIEPPLDERLQFGTGDTLDFHLILIGRAVDYVPYFIFGFEELGRLGIGT